MAKKHGQKYSLLKLEELSRPFIREFGGTETRKVIIGFLEFIFLTSPEGKLVLKKHKALTEEANKLVDVIHRLGKSSKVVLDNIKEEK